jgi:superfamily II DNA helicase RecQ
MDGREGSGLGEGCVIVITNILGLGIDVPDIRVVVYVGFIRNLKLKNYGQESRRAG